MPALDGLAGIIILAIFGSAFVITCGISAIKAIRDRTRLKKRKKQKILRKNKNYELGYEETSKKESFAKQSKKSRLESEKRPLPNTSNQRLLKASTDKDEKVDVSVYSISDGVDNLTFHQSDANFQIVDENNCSAEKSETENKYGSTCQTSMPKHILSYEKECESEEHSRDILNDRFVIRKITRRHSYETAVCEDSWIPLERPCCSRTQLNPLNMGEKMKESKATNVSYENRAFDENDFEDS